jgi:hypothetical protein
MMSILVELLTAIAQAAVAYEQANEADKAALEGQARAAIDALRGTRSAAIADHDARTAETQKEIDDALKVHPLGALKDPSVP